MTVAVRQALECAAELMTSTRVSNTRRSLAAAGRQFVIGDPQTTAERFFDVLHAHGLLEGGWLAPDVVLLSLGDYFDYDRRSSDVAEVARQGELILRWLAAHPSDQVVLLLGNHDAVRVTELAEISDTDFRAARELALAIEGQPEVEQHQTRAEFAARYPCIPTPEVAARDFCSFTESQRALVRQLLASRRLRLACAVGQGGHVLLATHAGVTIRELRVLGRESERSATELAAALNDSLDSAIDAVKADWTAGRNAALDLSPLHVLGYAPNEAGGFLYHRPSNPHRQKDRGAALGQTFDPDRPRRFDPVMLPVGLWQIVGHTGHMKCRKELVGWFENDESSDPGGLRTLKIDRQRITYRKGLDPVDLDAAGVYLVDSELHSTSDGAVRAMMPVDVIHVVS